MKVTEKENTHPAEVTVHVYSSGKRRGSIKMARSILRELPVAHSLGFRFAERNIKAKYRQSLFGFLWALLPPLSTALIWIILNKTNVVHISDVGVPYPVFVITGTMLWSIFSGSVLMPLQIVQSNKSILTKINFPREALIIDAFYEVLFNAGVTTFIIVLELLFFHIGISGSSLLFIPCVFLLIFLGMAVGLLLLPFSLLYKDVQFILPSLLQFVMYLTPVVYARPIYGGAAKILAFNPVSPVLSSARSWLLGMHQVAAWGHLAIVAAAAFLLFIAGIFLQRVTIEILIERMGS